MLQRVRTYTKQVGLVFLLSGVVIPNSEVEVEPITDSKFTIVIQECTLYPISGLVAAKAENAEKRVIIRAVHCLGA